MRRETTFENRATWLDARMNGIGASEAAAIVGLSPWATATDLWRQKRGETPHRDLSSNPAVQRGNRMEPILREFFNSLHDELSITYDPFRMVWQEERPWLFATLDGELHRENGQTGILEIKTAAPTGKSQWNEWRASVPDHYYVQVLHQFAATDYDFAVLFAALYERDGSIVLREYEFDRGECEDDIQWLVGQEEVFWRHVLNGTIPPVPLVMRG